jgi:hypothetical protein
MTLNKTIITKKLIHEDTKAAMSSPCQECPSAERGKTYSHGKILKSFLILIP